MAKGLELRNFLWETKLSLALPTRTRLYKKGRRKAVKRGGAVSIGHIGGQMTKSHATLREFFNDAISFVFGPRRDEQDIMDELWNSGMRPSFFMPTATAEFSTADGVSHCEEIEVFSRRLFAEVFTERPMLLPGMGISQPDMMILLSSEHTGMLTPVKQEPILLFFTRF
ncbi:MAG: hypothetical protein IPL82_09950 [Elusimicrobia bacterium]|nr:hypothetical protein [Elusimicrobiota bacterium]